MLNTIKYQGVFEHLYGCACPNDCSLAHATQNVNHPISFNAKKFLSVQLHTPDLLAKTDVSAHTALTLEKQSQGDRDKSIFARMKSGATLALHKFCFIKQSMKSSKNQHYHMTNEKQTPWHGSKEQTCLKTPVLHLRE